MDCLHHSPHQSGKDCGKLLACSITTKLAYTYITKIFIPKGDFCHTSPDITKAFQTYYTKLHNLSPQTDSTSMLDPSPQFLNYIKSTVLPTFSEETQSDLTLPFTAQEKHITLIPKSGNDPTQCARCCPISLINVGLKLFVKLIANRLQTYFLSLIHLEQVDFVP